MSERRREGAGVPRLVLVLALLLPASAACGAGENVGAGATATAPPAASRPGGSVAPGGSDASGSGGQQASTSASTSVVGGGAGSGSGSGNGNGNGNGNGPDGAAIFATLRAKLSACYEQGKSATPTMLDGKLTLNASVAASGQPACVIPSNDTGLTQEVEDCMSARFLETRFSPTRAAWSAAVPVAVRNGVVQLGEAAAAAAASFASIETYRMPDAFDVLESLVPELQACMQGVERSARLRSVLVGARVGADGRTQCALATSESLPLAVGECTAGVLRGAKFPPPKGGAGLVLVPIAVGAR
jgi:hypothetical protein